MIGIAMQVAGVCYLVNSITLLLAPQLEARLFPAVLLPAFLAELSFALWLLVKGVDVGEWHRQAALASAEPA
jgi:predicted small integral membrane protein